MLSTKAFYAKDKKIGFLDIRFLASKYLSKPMSVLILLI